MNHDAQPPSWIEVTRRRLSIPTKTAVLMLLTVFTAGFFSGAILFGLFLVRSIEP
jgi:hypothetical protein